MRGGEARATGGAQPIAVIGISCRFPRSPSPDAFWRLLDGGQQAVTEVPVERRALDGRPLVDPASAEPAGLRFGAFLDQVDRFDAAFFGIPPREAATMDPQQRLVLELGWEVLEDAGIVPDTLRGDRVGVFLGAMADDYSHLFHRGAADVADRHAVTGLHRGILANRVSYAFGLTGPSFTVDAAQSSSLVAVHLASESLLQGEAELALAGGVHLNLDPQAGRGISNLGALSPDGRCHTFDQRANGIVRGEGGGIVALKPLEAARANGDRVYCVIHGSAVGNDGPSEGLTVPSREAQASVVRRAWGRAGLSGADLQYVELHGTGTPVGDPIEAAALAAAVGASRSSPLPVGSVKTNIGHLEGAAGIAGLIKAVLAIERGRIPASLNFERPNPAIPLEALGLRVHDASAAWPDDGRPTAGVSSFGMGGTNCHVVVGEAPAADGAGAATEASADPLGTEGGRAESADVPLPGVIPLLLSAKSEPALRDAASRLASHLRANPALEPADVAHSLTATRTAFECRGAVLGGDREELLEGLASLAGDGEAPNLARGVAGSEQRPVFLFPGQGSQWEGMAVDLLDRSPVFERHLRACEEALAPFVEWSVRDVLTGAEGAPSIARIEVVQPVLFAVTASLAELWRSCGVHPVAVAGHSQGEIAAAYVAGGLSLSDAARLAAVRGRVISKLAGQGAMASVVLSAEQLAPRLDRWGGRIEIAAENGPSSTILSADRESLAGFLERCAEEGLRAREVPATIPSHSTYVEPLRGELLDALSSVAPRSGEIPFWSTVTGGLLDTALLDAEYWYGNLRQPVRFEQVTRGLLEQGRRLFVEISPHPVFSLSVEETIEEVLPDADRAAVLATLRRGEGGPERFGLSLAEAHAWGAELDWEASFAGDGAKRVALPTYPFQRERHWFEPGAPVEAATGPKAPAGLEGLLYGERWKPLPDPPPQLLSGTWLVVASPGQGDDPDVAAVVEAMRRHGARAVRGEGGDAAGAAEIAGVLSLVGLDEELDDSPSALLGATLELLGRLDESAVECPFWLATRGAMAVDASAPVLRPLQAQLWGLGRTLAIEQPLRWGGLVDLPEEVDEQALGRLCGILGDPGAEDQFAVRADGVCVRRLTHAAAAVTGAGWKPEGTVLVTGGDGPLGSEVARWLAREGAAHVLLPSREGSDPGEAEALAAELVEAGAEVTLARCDVAEREQVEELLASVPEERPLTAAFHAVGTLDEGVGDLGPGRLDSALSAKVRGAIHLDELTARSSLSAFVLFSSSSATFGASGRPVSAAANAFLDALAQDRRRRGLPATSIAWGPWALPGEGGPSEEQLRRHGLCSLDPAVALEALQRVLDGGEAAITAAAFDWERFAAVFAAARPRPLLDELPEAQPVLRGQGEPGAAMRIAETLASLPEEECAEHVLDLVRAEVAVVLGHDSAEQVDPARAFKELGFDSLAAVELRNRLNAVTGLRLPTTVVFNHPSPAALAAHLLGLIRIEDEPGAGSIEAELDRLESLLVETGRGEWPGTVAARLRDLLAVLEPARSDELGEATDEEMFEHLDRRLGRI